MSDDSNEADASALNLLISMGFAASDARDALVRHAGNVERAANALLLVEEEDSPPPTNTTNVVQIEGNISQYSYAEHGRSACTCIALQGARQFLAAMQSNHHRPIDAAFVDDMVHDGCRIYAEGYQNASSETNALEHTSVEDVIHLFPDLRMGPVRQGLLTDDGVALIQAAAVPSSTHDDWVCLILIKPPETVLVCLPPTNRTSDGPLQYYLFDSHPRRAEFGTAHAYVRMHASLPDLWSASIQRIFPAVRDLGPDVPAYLTALYNSWDVIPVRHVRRE